ncbi:MAG: hypothetical protein ACFFE8_06185 [Candidatus Heimdallarchaeota archaeon]
MDHVNLGSSPETGKLLPLIPQNILKSPARDRILNHWAVIPAIEDITDFSAFDLITKSEVRSAIMDLMRLGSEEFDPVTETTVVRHAFTAKEMLALIRSQIKKKITLSNVYFHLGLLEEKGFIEPIASIKIGRTTTSFFGRKAKLFFALADSGKEEFLEDDKTGKFLALLAEMDPSASLTDHKELMNQLRERRNELHSSIKKWISLEENEKMLVKLNIDLRDLYGFLLFVLSESQLPNETSLKMAKILNIK